MNRAYMRRQIIASVLGLICISAFAKPHFEFRGDWRIDRIVGDSHIMKDDRYLRGLIGERIHIERGSIVIGPYSCKTGKVTLEVNAPTDSLLFSTFLQLSRGMIVPRRTDILYMGACNEVFRNGDNIIVSARGAYYEASRIKK